LKEHKALAHADLRIVLPGGKITLGKFKVEFFPVLPQYSGRGRVYYYHTGRSRGAHGRF